MESWLWFVIFYVGVALVWTWRRYLRVADREAWKKDLSLHIIESLGWLLVLMRTDYKEESKTEKKDK